VYISWSSSSTYGGDSGNRIFVLYWRCSLIRVSVIRGSTVYSVCIYVCICTSMFIYVYMYKYVYIYVYVYRYVFNLTRKLNYNYFNVNLKCET
jgi:hypothetical protein